MQGLLIYVGRIGMYGAFKIVEGLRSSVSSRILAQGWIVKLLRDFWNTPHATLHVAV